MWMLTSKLPFIVIAAPKSCIVNRQSGVENSKYVVILAPLLTGHVIQRSALAQCQKPLHNGDVVKTAIIVIVAQQNLYSE